MMHPIYPRNIVNTEYVAYWENFLTDDDINLILNSPEWSNTEPAKIGGSTKNILDPSIRHTNISWLGRNRETKHIWEKFETVFAEVNRRFFHFDLTGFHEPMQLGIYTSDNSHYNWHIDSSAKDIYVPRKLSMALCLSDPSEFEGGELQVKLANDKSEVLDMAKGRAWFFPSWTLHRVTPVTKGIRKSLVIWAGGPQFK